MPEHPNDPLYGKTLKTIVEYLVKEYGFEKLSEELKLNALLQTQVFLLV